MKSAIFALTTALLFLAACSKSKPEEPADKDERASGLIQMTVDAQKHVDLQVEAAQVRQLNEFLQVPGTVQAIDSRVNTVRPLARGRLHDVHVKIGDRVNTGQPLATYDNVEAGELGAQIAGARAELQKLRGRQRNLARQTERARSLAGIGAIPKKEFEQAQADQQESEGEIATEESAIAGLVARLERFGVSESAAQRTPLTAITAPFAGVITKMKASPGEVVDAGSELFTIADLSTVWVQAEVYEKDLGRIRLGQEALVTVDTYPDVHFTGKVAYVSDFLDPQTRTAKVRCEVSNAAMRLKLDMFADVRLPTTFSRQALAVPAGAIQRIGERTVVFVRKSATTFEARTVTAGQTVRDWVEITGGLNAGETIVKTGSFHLKSILTGKDLGEE